MQHLEFHLQGEYVELNQLLKLVGVCDSGGTGKMLVASGDVSVDLATESEQNIQRMRESSIRALSACGQTRVWNLMIDVVAQTGRYPDSAKGVDSFVVDAEKRLWVHVAIDRLTGQIIDEQIEAVHE